MYFSKAHPRDRRYSARIKNALMKRCQKFGQGPAPSFRQNPKEQQFFFYHYYSEFLVIKSKHKSDDNIIDQVCE